MSLGAAVAGSFKDPAGRVYDYDGRILRTVTKVGAPAFDAALATGFLDRLVEEGRMVPFTVLRDPEIARSFPDAEYVLEHPRVEVISHPYEWSFGQLRAAGLLHLDIALDALECDLTLSDATAYNIQFEGHQPVFIDHLSFRPYKDGEFWAAHSQFCEQFLNPLLLRSELGISHNAWYRGSMGGIPTEQIARLLPRRARFSLRMNAHVFLPARYQRGTQSEALRDAKVSQSHRGLPRRGYEGLLRQLRGWIASMRPKDTDPTVWADYAGENTYSDPEAEAKQRVVAEFTAARRPAILLDLGCNSGFFSETALKAGAGSVVGFDSDPDALEMAYRRSVDCSLPFLPLFLDAANPSPDQGWAQAERAGFDERARGDAVLALAFIHHLAITRNTPLDQLVAWILARAPAGLIEFVPKSDPTVQSMLRFREDIFDDYNEETFAAVLGKNATIVNRTPVSATGRTIYEFERPSP